MTDEVIRTSKERSPEDAARSSAYWKAEHAAAVAENLQLRATLFEAQQALLREGLEVERLRTENNAVAKILWNNHRSGAIAWAEGIIQTWPESKVTAHETGEQRGYVLIPAAVKFLVEAADKAGVERVTFGVMDPKAGFHPDLPGYIGVISEDVSKLRSTLKALEPPKASGDVLGVLMVEEISAMHDELKANAQGKGEQRE